MTGHEKIAAAFSPNGTDDFAAVICYSGIYIRDHFAELTAMPWWTQYDLNPAVQARLIARQFEAAGTDWFDLRPGASLEEQRAVRVVERDGAYFRCDARDGREERLHPPRVGGSLSVLSEQSPVIDDLARFLEEHVRQGEPFAGVADGRDELPRRLLATLGRTKLPLGSACSPLWAIAYAIGYEQWLTGMATDPDAIFAAARRYLFNAIQSVKLAAAIGCRAIWIEDCMTDMIGPARFARYNLPLVQELAQAIRDAGMWSVHYYCGNPWPVMDLLLETGADALSLEEGKKGFDIDIAEVVARTRGRMTVLGNLDAIDLLEHGTPDDLRREIARQLDAGRRNHGRFIMSIGSPVTPGTSVARVREYAALVRELSVAGR